MSGGGARRDDLIFTTMTATTPYSYPIAVLKLRVALLSRRRQSTVPCYAPRQDQLLSCQLPVSFKPAQSGPYEPERASGWSFFEDPVSRSRSRIKLSPLPKETRPAILQLPSLARDYRDLEGHKASVSGSRLGVHAADQTVPFTLFALFSDSGNVAYSAA